MSTTPRCVPSSIGGFTTWKSRRAEPSSVPPHTSSWSPMPVSGVGGGTVRGGCHWRALDLGGDGETHQLLRVNGWILCHMQFCQGLDSLLHPPLHGQRIGGLLHQPPGRNALPQSFQTYEGSILVLFQSPHSHLGGIPSGYLESYCRLVLQVLKGLQRLAAGPFCLCSTSRGHGTPVVRSLCGTLELPPFRILQPAP